MTEVDATKTMSIEDFEQVVAQFYAQAQRTHALYVSWRFLVASPHASKIFSQAELAAYKKHVDQARVILRRLYRHIEQVSGKSLPALELYYV